MKDLITAIGLLLFIEGLIVAMFPSRIKNMLKMIENIPNNKPKTNWHIISIQSVLL